MLLRNIITTIAILTSAICIAQLPSDTVLSKGDVFVELQQSGQNEGSVVVTQDAKIHYLVNKHIAINEEDKTIDGWRIQIYNSSGKEAREEANDVREKFLNKYPDVKAYLIYQPPYFKIRVGDYRTKQDAYEVYVDMVKSFPVSYLVPDKINLPEL